MIPSLDAVQVIRPRTLKEALRRMSELERASDPLVPLAGGTDVFVGLNAGAEPARRYLDLWTLDELRGIRIDGKALVIGALATWTDCVRSKAVERRLPILAAAAREVGGAQIQNRGTIGGNIGNGSPAGDGLPVLAAADAVVVLRSEGGERHVPMTSFYTGYRASVRRPDELIVEVRVPKTKDVQHFRKVGTRAAQAISKVVIAAVGDRIAFGSVAPTVVRARAVEGYLGGGGRDAEEARRLLDRDIAPIDDVRSTADYRRRVAGNLLVEYLRGR